MRNLRVSGDDFLQEGPHADEQRAYRVIVLHHTHWDREWWTTFQDLRIRLVEFMDELLDVVGEDPEFRNFLLDGQTIVLRDYLEIRPENRHRLARAIREGRIQCGPWYILPDEFLVSGEAHIRNLWLGRRTADDLGVPVQQAGYIPDTFGHIAQMPQILQGFGIDNAFLWRGRGGDPETVKQEFLWEAPDGSEVLTHWFPDGYYWMPFLHLDNPDRPYEDRLGRVFRSVEHWSQRATSNVLLMPYGGDHRPIDRHLARKIARANEAVKGVASIQWGTIEDYLAAVRERNPVLERVRGELRSFGSDTPHLLPGVLSTRLYLKRLNFRGQTWLERYAEPFSALAWLRGRRYDTGLLWKAWGLLLQNHPHDSICGCSIDQVHREMIPRFDQAWQIARILAEKTVQHINAGIDTSSLEAGDRALVVHNPLPRRRGGWSSVWIERADINPRTYVLRDSAGQETPFQVRDVEGQQPMTDTWRYSEIGFAADDVPGLGYRTYTLSRRDVPLDSKQRLFTAVQPVAVLKGSKAVTDLKIGSCALENRYLRVEVDPRHGTLDLTDKLSGDTYRGLNVFEDGGDAGDSYNYSAPLGDLVLRSGEGARAHVSLAEAGYARATLRVDLVWPLPAELAEDRLSRSSAYVETQISTFITVTAGARYVEVITEWENRSKDHRLRALFPLGSAARLSHAQGQFEVSDRPVDHDDTGNGWPEPPVFTMPQQGWVSVHGGQRGLTIANRGLPEYEVLPDGRGTIALTLLRSIGWVSRDDMLARVGGAGPEIPAPDAQCLGRNRVSYAIIPHAGDWLEARSFEIAQDYLVPLYGSETSVHAGTAPRNFGFLELTGNHTLEMSACKRAEGGDRLILRFWNTARQKTEACVVPAHPVTTVRLVDLKEDPLEGEPVALDEDGGFLLGADAAQIVTVALSFSSETPVEGPHADLH